MSELSLFLDESGSDGLLDRYYILTIVLHEQDSPIGTLIEKYESSLRDRNLPNIPFHMTPPALPQKSL